MYKQDVEAVGEQIQLLWAKAEAKEKRVSTAEGFGKAKGEGVSSCGQRGFRNADVGVPGRVGGHG